MIPEENAVPKYLNRRQAAAYLNVSLRTLSRLLASGDLPRRKIRKRVVVARADLDRLAAPLGPACEKQV